MKYKILKQISLKGVNATGRTRHFMENQQMTMPALLQIAQYDNDTGFYLFYLNEENEVMTDTYHETIDGAIDQTEWEFEISSDKWIDF